MKKYVAFACLLWTSLLAGCYKDKTDTTTYTVPFTLLNALAASSPDLLVVTGNQRTAFSQKSVAHFYSDDGVNVTGLWTYGLSSQEPSLVQVYVRLDSTKPFFSKLIAPEPGLRHNLLVTGTLEAPQFLYLHDSPAPPADSSMGIRFVNLSRNLSNISVNIAGQTPGSEVADLPYLQASAFKHYSAKAGSNQYVFEMADKSTGEVIFAYPFTTIPFTNTNICLRGLQDGRPELQVTTVYQ